jgi:CRP/FNR family transcriptional regulator, cyclic AMP receptor protein
VLLIERTFFLKKVSIFQRVDHEVLGELAHCFHEVSLPKGQQVIKQGEMGDQLFIIVSGAVEVMENGKKLEELKEKAIFGELALLSPAPRSSDVFTSKESLLLCLERKDFLDSCSHAPEILFGVIEELSNRIRLMNQKLAKWK